MPTVTHRDLLLRWCSLIRSKNAGPFDLTFDFMAHDRESYEQLRRHELLTPALFARLFATPEEQVRFFHHDAAMAIKVSLPRPVVQGELSDMDGYGGQQYAAVLDTLDLVEVADPQLTRLADLPEGHPGRRILTGRTPFFAAPSEPRCSYTTYVPTGYDGTEPAGVLVAVHGTRRDAEYTRDRYIELAEEQRLIVVAPLFPAGLGDPDDLHNYKFVESDSIRFDLVLLQILEQVEQRWNARTDRVLLCGHSGGAQFAHRFCYLHPDRVAALALSAPGRVTLLDDTADWWSGTRDTEARFGIRVAPAALRRIPVHLVIGEEDDGLADLAATETAGQDQPGRTRLERLAALAGNLRDHGLAVTTTTVPGAGHDSTATAPAMARFFAGLPR
ncbi:DUF4387 family protein [Amycolatopsis sp. NPDC098790]|uniref:DUF4387 family protein n=1 Tax=Amycolatopsis sp. NPDC098790 TaxID=3363939 RepID=UPI00381E6C57